MPHKDQQVEAAEWKERAAIARGIVIVGSVALFLLAIVVIVATAIFNPTNLGTTTQTLFSALLPLVGTWVGTILAYYFSRENFQTASRTFLDTVKELTPIEKLGKIPVKDAMLKIGAIKAVKMKAGQSEKDIKLEELKKLLDGVVTRIPVLDDKGAVRYVIHQSMLYKFIAEESCAKKTAFQFAAVTLEDFLNFEQMKDYVSRTRAFVAADQTLADAKVQMEAVPGSQDVFVTEHGKPDEPVLGWLTNIDIAKHAKV